MRLLLLFFLLSFSVVSAKADFTSLATQRVIFTKAKLALQQGNTAEFLLFAQQLQDYPLYPYLMFAQINQHLDQASEQEVSHFLQKYSDTLLAGRLRYLWLLKLAQQKNWPLFFKYYQASDDVDLQCQHAQGLLDTGKKELAYQHLAKLWLTGSTLPASCENAFTTWRQAKQLTDELIWKRAVLAVENNNQDLLNKLISLSSSNQQALLKLWQAVIKNPRLVEQPHLFQLKNDKAKVILMDGITRYAKANSQQVVAAWPKLQSNYNFNVDEQQTLQREIAIALARSNDPAATAWLALINPSYTNQRIREWRIRNALIQKNWLQASRFLAQLTPQESASNIWQYWRARVLAELGQKQSAQYIYQGLARKVDYYGVLASQQMNQPYNPPNKGGYNNGATMRAITNLPAMQRARELYALRFTPDARREWQWAIEKMSKPQLSAAAQLAYQWQWYDRGIITVAKAGEFNNLTIRYPLAYLSEIMAASKQLNVIPAWIYAIMRQESSFMSDAKSGVGALGLMQVMPNTAKALARMNVTQNQLLNYSTNIYLGTTYLNQLSGWYKGNIVIASAAYNVGPTRLKKWLPLYKTVPYDIWVESLPWQETRDYVKAIVLGSSIYQQKLKRWWPHNTWFYEKYSHMLNIIS